MPRLDRRAAPALFNAYLQPERSGRRARRDRAEDAQAIAQDYLQYMRSDYEQRRSHGRRSWRDLYPAYAFALTTHYADWPRGADDTDGELAEHWEQMRGQSRLGWYQARAVVEDAWLALDHMPAAAVHGLLQ